MGIKFKRLKYFLSGIFFLFTFTPCVSAKSGSIKFLEDNFKGKDACFYMVDLDTGKTIVEFNNKRCKIRLPPCSTFKIPIAVMAFDSNFFKTEDQVIKWDGKSRWMKSHNQHQTPRSFMERSVIWVSRLVVNHLGKKKVQNYVNNFEYGNKLVSGDLNSFWLSDGSVKISAVEQVDFLTRLWTQKIKLSTSDLKLVKKLMLVKATKDKTVYGKTGTGCIDKNCISNGGRQLGWFAGVLEHKTKKYAFAANYSDLSPSKGYAGPNIKKMIDVFFKEFYP